MDHQDHVNLLRGGVPSEGGVWADFGSGQGAFTLALAELIGPEGLIISVDSDQGSVKVQKDALHARFPERPPKSMLYMVADFTQSLDVPPLDGLVMANSLHFQRLQDKIVQQVHAYLRPGGCFIVVEYNLSRGNPWIPFPVPFSTLKELANRNGFTGTRLLATRPSRVWGEIYSAIAFKPEENL